MGDMREYIVNRENVYPYGYQKEEVVRCRDCKHMHTVRNWVGLDECQCWLHASRETGALGKERVEPNGFCAWGERKEVSK